MKKTAKIFAMALSIVLMLSLFLVVSYANDEQTLGVSVAFAEDFEGYSIGNFYKSTRAFIIGDRSGAYEVRTSDNGNKYATQAFDSKDAVTNTAAPYITMPMLTPQLVNGALTTPTYPIYDQKYYAFEFDYMTPTGKHTQKTNMSTYFASYYINSDGARKSYYFSSCGSEIVINHGEKDGEYTLTSSTETAIFKSNPGQWRHFTVIVEPNTTANMTNGSVDSYNLSKTTIYVYIDGELVLMQKNALASAVATVDRVSNYYNGTLDYTVIADFRLNFSTAGLSDSNSDQLSAYDNLKTSVFSKDYDGDHADVAKYNYNENYVKPGVSSVAKVDDVGYGWIVEAMEAAKNASKLELFCDAVGIHRPQCAQTVITNGYKFEYDEGDFLIASTDSLGNVSFREPREDEKHTVNWYNPDGTVRKTETVVNGKFARPDAPPVLDFDGWYAAEYVWGLEDGSVATDENYLIASSVNFYPIVKDVYPTLKGAMYNMRMTGGFEMFLALPSRAFPAGVLSLEVKRGESAISPISAVDGYNIYSAGIVDIAKSADATADLTLNIAAKLPSGEERKLSFTVALSPMEYMRALLRDGEYIKLHGSLAAIVCYCEALAQNSEAELGDRINFLIKNYGQIYPTAAKMPTANASLGTASAVIERIGFTVGESAPVIHITFKPDTRVKEISFKITKGDGEGALSFIYGADELRTLKGADGYISELYSVGIPLHLLDGAIDISVSTEDESLVGTYTLSSFYGSVAKGAQKHDGTKYSADEADGVKLVTSALYTAAVSLNAYLYGEASIPAKAREFVITYEDYDALGDGVSDDYAAIKAAHDFANSLAADGYVNVVVRASRDAVYYIGANNGYQSGEKIVIKTDVDWNGASFIIDDSAVLDGSRHIFEVAPEDTPKTYNAASKGAPGEAIAALNKSGIKPGTQTVIDLGIGAPMLLRMSVGAGAYETVLDVIVDGKGKISKDTPIDREYNVIYGIYAYRLDCISISIKDGSFTTTPATAVGESVFKRGILINRFGVLVSDLTHSFAKLGEDETAAEYSDFIDNEKQVELVEKY